MAGEDQHSRTDAKRAADGLLPESSTSRQEAQVLRKAVNTLAIVPRSARITTLGRKAYNVLLFTAQEQGVERDVYRAPLESIIKGVDFDSNDHALIKKHLRSMVSTTVEWQSPTTGEGAAWNVSGLLAHARLTKERGQVFVEWSYAVNLKQELLDPNVYARLRLEIISQLRSHAAVVLYEICTRYKDIGRTSRQAWRWWVPVLTGVPTSERSAKLEYRVFKRDTLKPAIAEVSAITDVAIELVEHKQGRFVDEIQFSIGKKSQAVLGLVRPPEPVDLRLAEEAQKLGVSEEAMEGFVSEFGEAALRQGLEALSRRVATAFPEPVRDPVRYLKSILPGTASSLEREKPDRDKQQREANAQTRLVQAARRERWQAEWTRRAHEKCSRAILELSEDAQRSLEADLLAALQARGAHPSIVKRLQTSGWQHPLVRSEMIRFFGDATFGADWDKPTAEDLLAIAAELSGDLDARGPTASAG